MPPRVRRLLLNLAIATGLAAAPKCALCALAYAGLGTALGLGGPKLCAAAESAPVWPLALGAAVAGAFLLRHRAVRALISPARGR